MEFTNIIEKLNTFISPSGNERKLLEYIKTQVQDYVDECSFDIMGNLIAVMGKDHGEKVMFTAHADTIGFICHYIDENGFIRFQALGGIDFKVMVGKKVKFTNGVLGVIYYEEKTKEKITSDNCYIDIGASSAEETAMLVPIGTAASLEATGFITANSKRYVSTYLDNRIAIALQIELIKLLKKSELKNELYFVFTVQEEVGTRGAKTAAFNIEPKYALAFDVTSTGDIPECEKLNMKLGGGACIKVLDYGIYCHPEIVRFLTKIAEKNKIKYQYEILNGGSTDAAAIHTTKNGVYTGAISVATRYVHSQVEMIDLEDYENAKKLILACIENGYEL